MTDLAARPTVNGVTWRGVGFGYPDGPDALREVDLDAPAGEILLVVGDSGSGKSTLLRTTNGLVPHTSGGRFTGEVQAFGRTTATHRPRDLADVIGFVHQDPEAQFVIDHVEHDLAFVLENMGVDQRTMRRRVEEVLDALGIAHLRDRSPATLSGGERQRCAIAGALAAAPAALVLDEPTSMLDPQGADDVLAAVARLNDDLGTTVLLAEHRLDRAAPLAHRAVLVHDGRVSPPDSPHAVLAPYAGAPVVTHLGRLLGWDPLPLTVREARAAVRAAGRPDLAPPAVPADRAAAPGRPLVTATGLDAAPGGNHVLRGVDLTVREGEIVAVLGRNGAGKTTLLRCLAAALGPSSGTVTAAVPVAYVPQEPDALLFSPTVRRELGETLRLLGRRDHEAVDRWLDALGLTPLADRHPRSLSTGQRQRVAIGAVAIGGAPVLVLDEPTRGIDAPSRAALKLALLDHAAGGGAVVLATHDVELAARVATRVLVLGDGEPVAEGPAREVLAGSLFAPQVLRVLPPYLTLAEVATGDAAGDGALMSTTPTHAPVPPIAPALPPSRAESLVARARAGLVYLLVGLVGAGAFLYPFWIPSEALPNQAHTGDAPLVAALVGLLAVAAVTLEVRRGTMNGSTVALLGVLSATAGLLKLFDLPGGGSGIFFLVVLAGAAFGPRFGLLLGLTSFVVAAVLSGGVGPWLPFQMLALAWMGAGAGVVGRLTDRLPPWVQLAALAAYAWAWGFLFGAIMNLWFWPFVRDGGPLSWQPGLSLGETLHHYWSFYVATSFAWDAAGALTNALAIILVGRPILRTLRRFAHRLEPVVILDPAAFTPTAPANVE